MEDYMKVGKVSDAVIRRLPRYYRELLVLRTQGVERVSSEKLAARMRLNASQVRQDFNCFGGFGQQGYGYNVTSLLSEVRRILALNREYKLVIVGAGNMGHALANFEGFANDGFHVVALFDNNEALIGKEINGKPVLSVATLGDYIRANGVDIGVITARRSFAQELADAMIEAGIKGIWNFAPIDIEGEVAIENVHLSDILCALTYRMEHGNEAEE